MKIFGNPTVPHLKEVPGYFKSKTGDYDGYQSDRCVSKITFQSYRYIFWTVVPGRIEGTLTLLFLYDTISE